MKKNLVTTVTGLKNLSLFIFLSLLMIVQISCTEQAQKDAMFRQGVKALYTPISLSYNRMVDEDLAEGKITEDTARIERNTDTQLKSFINTATK
jgi:hypothetical protein